MKTLKLAFAIAVIGSVGMQVSFADSRSEESGNSDVPQRYNRASSYHEPLAPAISGSKKYGDGTKLVFVTGSRIPQRVKVKAIGTATTSPVRVITREEIDRTGKFTTRGILTQDPSIF